MGVPVLNVETGGGGVVGCGFVAAAPVFAEGFLGQDAGVEWICCHLAVLEVVFVFVGVAWF